ncbi:MAG: tetratricopeptide repeat protein [Candidatus Heimdallarchaeota archaeon]
MTDKKHVSFLTDIEKLNNYGKYAESLRKINHYLGSQTLTKIDEVFVLIKKVETFLALGQNKNAGGVLNYLAVCEKELKINKITINVNLVQLEYYFALGMYDEITNLIYSCEQLADEILEEELKYYKTIQGRLIHYRGLFFEVKGEFDEALKCYTSANKLFKELKNKKRTALSLVALGRINRYKGNRKGALEYYRQALKIWKTSQYSKGKASTLKEIGSIYLQESDYDKALRFYDEAIAIFRRIGKSEDIARMHNNFGVVNEYSGDLKKALEHYQQGLGYFKEIGNKQYIGAALHNIGGILTKMGHLDDALIHIKEGLTIFQELSNIQNIAAALNNIGTLYNLQGKYEEAIVNFQLALNLREKIKNNLSTSSTIYYMINALLDKGDFEKAGEFFTELKTINEKDKTAIISQRALAAEGLLLKNSERARLRVRAEEIFEDLLSQDITDNRLRIDAKLGLCEVLLFELKESGNNDLLKEVKAHIEDILLLAKKQQSMILFAQGYWFKSQLALLEFNIQEAKQFLNQAQLTAEEWGITTLASRISADYDTLLDQVEEWEQLIQREAPIAERFKAARLQEFLTRVFRGSRLDSTTLPDEEPIMLLFLKPSGLPLYSRNFMKEDKIDESLISGFLSAINSFGKQAFAARGLIERIKHRDYTIILQMLEPYLICYVFKGQSFSALKRVSEFIAELKLQNTLWRDLEKLLESTEVMPDDNRIVLDQIIEKVFPVMI